MVLEHSSAPVLLAMAQRPGGREVADLAFHDGMMGEVILSGRRFLAGFDVLQGGFIAVDADYSGQDPHSARSGLNGDDGRRGCHG